MRQLNAPAADNGRGHGNTVRIERAVASQSFSAEPKITTKISANREHASAQSFTPIGCFLHERARANTKYRVQNEAIMPQARRVNIISQFRL
jgi:hypothetical protein